VVKRAGPLKARHVRVYKSVKKRFLRDPGVRKEYEALGPEFELIESIIRRRMELKMSQEELAAEDAMRQTKKRFWVTS
jgi:hypothetical protein